MYIYTPLASWESGIPARRTLLNYLASLNTRICRTGSKYFRPELSVQNYLCRNGLHHANVGLGPHNERVLIVKNERAVFDWSYATHSRNKQPKLA